MAVVFCRKPREKFRIDWRIAAVIAALVGFQIFTGFRLGAHQVANSDASSYMPIIRKLVEGPFLAPVDYYTKHFFLFLGAASYNIFFLAVGVAAKLARADVTVVWVYLPVLLGPVTMAALYAFVTEAFSDRRVGLVAAILYVWVNHLYFPLGSMAVGHWGALYLLPCYVALACLFRYLRSADRVHLVLGTLLGALAVMIYLGAFYFLAVSLLLFGLWLFFIDKDSLSARRVGLFLLCFVGMSVPYLLAILPHYVSILPVHSSQVPAVERFVTILGWRVVAPSSVFAGVASFAWVPLSMAGALALAPLLLLYHRKTLWGAFFLSLILSLPLTMFNPVAVEAMLLVIFPTRVSDFPQALVRFAAIPVFAFFLVRAYEWFRGSFLGPRAAAACAVSFLAWLLFLGWPKLQNAFDNVYPPLGFLLNPPRIYRAVREIAEPNSVVASVTPRVVVFANVRLPLATLDEIKRIFHPDTPLEETLRLLKRYRVNYVLNFTPSGPYRGKYASRRTGLSYLELVFPESKFERWRDHFERIHSDQENQWWVKGEWVLYRVRFSK